jgi:molecular chaperone GrpE
MTTRKSQKSNLIKKNTPVSKNKNKKNMQTSITKNFEIQRNLENQIQKLEKEIAQLKTKNQSSFIEVEDWKNKSLRIAAELQNNQKQQELDIAQTQKRMKKITVDSIFSFINTLNISFNFKPTSKDPKVTSFIETLEISYNQVLKEMKSIGIEIIETNVGDKFNPEYMTILNDTRTSESDDAIIKQVVSVGLKIDGQIIQPLSVIL